VCPQPEATREILNTLREPAEFVLDFALSRERFGVGEC
jgi:hypothetical protein